MPLSNDRLLRALKRQPVDMTPVWLMRQAGRYLPEYRKTRARAKDFLVLCKTPELACEVTLQPLARFHLDAAIIFSDILTVPDAMGLELNFVENEGPKFAQPLTTPQDILKLKTPEVETELSYVREAIRLVSKELNQKIPLIGFSGSPWTLATYMIEGGGSKTFSKIKKWAFDEPVALQQLLERLAQTIVNYLSMQIEAGVQVVMIFDTWGGILTPRDYVQFSLQHMQAIVEKIKLKHPDTPVILFTKNCAPYLEKMAQAGSDGLGIDWTIDLKEAKLRTNNQVALQGNMDPSILYAKPSRIEQEVQTILASYGHGPGHIFNLGHGIHPDIPPEHVSAFVEAVHQFSKTYHQC